MIVVRATALAVVFGAVAACTSGGTKPAASGPATYRAVAVVLVTSSGGSAAPTQSVADLATSPDVLRLVSQDLHLTLSRDDLTAKISAEPSDDGHVHIFATDRDPHRAVAIANADALGVVEVGRTSVPGAHLAVAQPATAPTAPVK